MPLPAAGSSSTAIAMVAVTLRAETSGSAALRSDPGLGNRTRP